MTAHAASRGIRAIAASAVTFAPYIRATTETTDHDLVAAVRRGDDQAFERLYERYHRRIAAYIYGMVNDYGRAEDIAQDVFMSALRRMRETDRPIAFKPWVYEIAKNACIDQFRRSRRAEEVSYDADEGMGAADYGRLVNTGPTPDVAVDTKMSLDHLRGAFGGLSDTHHQILVMRELEGLSYREIGERLGMSRPSVESTLFRARRRLSEEYEDLVSGERCSRVQAIIAAAAEGVLGTRDQRKLAKHVAHCQSCRRHARLAGVDAAVTAVRPVRARIAAFLPLPAFLRRRFEGEDAAVSPSPTSSTAISHHAGSFAQWSAQVSASVDPAIAGWAKAAAAAATLAIAGVGVAGSTQSLDLRSTLPSGAVTKALQTERAAVRHRASTAGTAAAVTAGSDATRSTATSKAAPASAPAPAHRSSGSGGSAGSGGNVAGQTATPASSGTPSTPSLPPVPALSPSDGTGEPTGPGRPNSGGSGDLTSQVTKVLPVLPSGASTGAAAPGDAGTTDAAGTVDQTSQTVTGVINP